MTQPRDPKIYATTDGEAPDPNHTEEGAPKPLDPATGQYLSYWVLSAEERARGFVRPVRRSYKHLVCGNVTSMGQAIAETYAANPSFYSATFCYHCRTHLPVGAEGEFVWMDDGVETQEKVGT